MGTIINPLQPGDSIELGSHLYRVTLLGELIVLIPVEMDVVSASAEVEYNTALDCVTTVLDVKVRKVSNSSQRQHYKLSPDSPDWAFTGSNT